MEVPVCAWLASLFCPYGEPVWAHEHSSRKLPIFDWDMEGRKKGLPSPTIPPGAHGPTPTRFQLLKVVLLPSSVNGEPSHEHTGIWRCFSPGLWSPSGQHPATVQVLITFSQLIIIIIIIFTKEHGLCLYNCQCSSVVKLWIFIPSSRRKEGKKREENQPTTKPHLCHVVYTCNPSIRGFSIASCSGGIQRCC